jgi:lysophospholipase L1-like esterase
MSRGMFWRHKSNSGAFEKSVMAVFWFTVIGAALFISNRFFFNFSGETAVFLNENSAETAGPLPHVAATHIESFKKEADLLAANLKIKRPHQPLDESPDSMKSFVKALEELASGSRREPVRILHYGDSILTTDQLSGQVRFILQKKFGDGGHGFVLAGKPWRWYHHLGVEHGANKKWRIRPFTSAPLKDGLYGLGGVAFQGIRGSHGKVWAGTAIEGDLGREVKFFDISYLAQPGGGSFKIFIDGEYKETVNTQNDEKKTMHKTVTVPVGPAKLLIEFNNDGLLRLFGIVLETGEPGIVYDSLAVNGARASALARFDFEHWKKELRHRSPSLVILMMGANEGANQFLVVHEYREHLAKILKFIRESLPESSCLVVGPLDQAKRNEDRTFGSKKMPFRLTMAQREVALENGCAFFNTIDAMGGEGSMGKWFRTGLGGGDLIHPTEAGARRIGNWLTEALLYSYQQHRINGFRQ